MVMKKYLMLLMVSSLILSACGGGTVENKIGSVKDKLENKVEEKKTSIKDLLGLGKEQKCEWSSETEGVKTSGRLWIKGNKFRQSVLTKIADKPEVAAEVLTDGEWTYLWNPTTKEQGMKIKMTEKDKEENNKLANDSLNLGKEFNYKCTATSVSDEEMTPPKDVTFMDLGALQEQMKGLIPSGVEIPTEGE